MELPSQHSVVSSVDEDDEDDEDEEVEVRGTTAGSRNEPQQQHATGLTANQQPPLPAGVQRSATPPQRPSETPPTTTAQTKSPAPSAADQVPPPLPLPTAGSAPQV